jgi:hypothetical protein
MSQPTTRYAQNKGEDKRANLMILCVRELMQRSLTHCITWIIVVAGTVLAHYANKACRWHTAFSVTACNWLGSCLNSNCVLLRKLAQQLFAQLHTQNLYMHTHSQAWTPARGNIAWHSQVGTFTERKIALVYMPYNSQQKCYSGTSDNPVPWEWQTAPK